MLERPRERRDPAAGLSARRCDACGTTTTHTGDVCTGCAARAENRKVGLLWLGLAAPLLSVGLWALSTIPRWPPPVDHRGSAGLGLLLALGGLVLGARGLRGVLLGRSPEGS